ncbi:hypothetical protein V8E55_006638 [Tylopilus felleus]
MWRLSFTRWFTVQDGILNAIQVGSMAMSTVFALFGLMVLSSNLRVMLAVIPEWTMGLSSVIRQRSFVHYMESLGFSNFLCSSSELKWTARRGFLTI